MRRLEARGPSPGLSHKTSTNRPDSVSAWCLFRRRVPGLQFFSRARPCAPASPQHGVLAPEGPRVRRSESVEQPRHQPRPSSPTPYVASSTSRGMPVGIPPGELLRQLCGFPCFSTQISPGSLQIANSIVMQKTTLSPHYSESHFDSLGYSPYCPLSVYFAQVWSFFFFSLPPLFFVYY